MFIRIVLTGLCCIYLSIGVAQTWSAKLESKVLAAVNTTYQGEKTTLAPTKSIQKGIFGANSPIKADGFYDVISNQKKIGLAYVGEAASMKDVFDYIIMFDNNLTIKKAKVLIYREQHGAQIGTVRWLSQFEGMGLKDKPKLGTTVDGISGATISSTSMTDAVAQVLGAVSKLKQEGIIQ